MSSNTLLGNGVGRVLADAATMGTYELYKFSADSVLDPGRQAKQAQKDLENQRRQELQDQANARAAAEATAAVRGQNFGSRTGLLDGFGFGGGAGGSRTGLGYGQLFA